MTKANTTKTSVQLEISENSRAHSKSLSYLYILWESLSQMRKYTELNTWKITDLQWLTMAKNWM